jgi:hypothetical protein
MRDMISDGSNFPAEKVRGARAVFEVNAHGTNR